MQLVISISIARSPWWTYIQRYLLWGQTSANRFIIVKAQRLGLVPDKKVPEVAVHKIWVFMQTRSHWSSLCPRASVRLVGFRGMLIHYDVQVVPGIFRMLHEQGSQSGIVASQGSHRWGQINPEKNAESVVACLRDVSISRAPSRNATSTDSKDGRPRREEKLAQKSGDKGYQAHSLDRGGLGAGSWPHDEFIEPGVVDHEQKKDWGEPYIMRNFEVEVSRADRMGYIKMSDYEVRIGGNVSPYNIYTVELRMNDRQHASKHQLHLTRQTFFAKCAVRTLKFQWSTKMGKTTLELSLSFNRKFIDTQRNSLAS